MIADRVSGCERTVTGAGLEAVPPPAPSLAAVRVPSAQGQEAPPLPEPGLALVREGTALPEDLHLGWGTFMPGWWLPTGLRAQDVDKKLERARWHFFYMAEQVAASAWGRNENEAAGRAMMKLLRNCDAKFNSVEITGYKAKSVGPLHHVKVTAHPRHIQASPILFEANKYCRRFSANEQNAADATARPREIHCAPGIARR
jgi:hypothetical protein